MTTEEMVKVMKAYTKGEPIECKMILGEDNWGDVIDNPSWDWLNYEYRIKPETDESGYRQYENINEMLENISKRLVAIQHPVFPGVWLQRTDFDVQEMIAGIDYTNSYVLIGTNWLSLGTVFHQYTYLDGTPFGVKE